MQELLSEEAQPWPRLERLAVSCRWVREEMGSQLVRALPALRSLEWEELPGSEEVGAAAAAAAAVASALPPLLPPLLLLVLGSD